jgi:hypothetical protein
LVRAESRKWRFCGEYKRKFPPSPTIPIQQAQRFFQRSVFNALFFQLGKGFVELLLQLGGLVGFTGGAGTPGKQVNAYYAVGIRATWKLAGFLGRWLRFGGL